MAIFNSYVKLPEGNGKCMEIPMSQRKMSGTSSEKLRIYYEDFPLAGWIGRQVGKFAVLSKKTGLGPEQRFASLCPWKCTAFAPPRPHAIRGAHPTSGHKAIGLRR